MICDDVIGVRIFHEGVDYPAGTSREEAKKVVYIAIVVYLRTLYYTNMYPSYTSYIS